MIKEFKNIQKKRLKELRKVWKKRWLKKTVIIKVKIKNLQCVPV